MHVENTVKLKIPVVYSEKYYIEIGEHLFPTSKYRILRELIGSEEALSDRVKFVEPGVISDDIVSQVHTVEYVRKLRAGTLTDHEIITLELPFSPSLVDASFTCCAGTLTAAREALSSGAAIHLGGGFHHAFADHGEGFCVLNDIAVAVKALKDEGAIGKALIIDCDLHQGNGTASIFADEPDVFTFSIHQEHNYPFLKEKSDLDVGLKDYAGDKEYLGHIYDTVPKMISAFDPDLIVYVAGADPYFDDQLGNLYLSKKGLRERDNFICIQARNFNVPVAITLAGGYARKRDDTVGIHFGTVEECLRVFCGK